MVERVLIIDDDQHLLSSFRRQLGEQFDLETAQGGIKGIEAVMLAEQRSRPFAVVVSDMRMPGMDGIETLTRIREAAPDTVRMMLTGNADQQTAIDAINQGHIFRFYAKPTSADYLALGLLAGIEQFHLVTAEKELLEKTLAGSISLLSDVMTLNDPSAGRLSTRLKDYVRRLTVEFNMPQRWQLEVAALLSPLGDSVVPPEILAKKRARQPLSEVERDLLAQAPETARRLIANIPRLGKVAEIVYLQDRGFDGSGFPATGPAGAQLPLDVRLLRILKDLAARIDETGVTHAAALADMARHGGPYDPQLLAKVRSCLEREPVAPAGTVRQSPVMDLCVGDVLASDIRLDNGHLILASGTTIGAAQIERLRNLQKIFRFADPVDVLEASDG